MSFPRIGLAALALAFASGLTACSPERAPDVVVVTLDTVRADRLGCYGYAGGLTPRLDAFASRAVVFEDASCAVPVTLPSHATLFTGRYPTQTGVRNNGTFILPPGETTLAEALRAAGWRTGAVIAAYPLASRYGLAQGFEIYDEDLPPIEATAGQAFSVHFSERNARAVTDRALEVWSRLGGGPRFLWVHYFDAHAPYEPPEPWAKAHAEAPYEGEIAFVDSELGRLLERIGRDAPRAIVVVAGDHGEGLGEHGEKTHGIFLYQSTVHVPLVIGAPGRWPAGIRVPTPVSLADVFPTVLTLAGVAVPSHLDGVPLSAAVTGGTIPRREVYAESLLALLQFRFSPLRMVREGPYKYIDAPAVELYDVRADPSEGRNLVGTLPEERAMAARLADLIARGDPEADRRAAGSLDRESEARLRALGYAAAGTPSAGVGNRRRDPKSMVAYLERYDRAVGEVAAGRIDEGIAELRALIPLAPENFMTRYQLAAALVAAGRADEANSELEQVTSAAPEFGSAHLMRALCLASSGRLDEAIASFNTAAQRMPTTAEPMIAKGAALEARGRFDAAADAYREAIEREPASAEAVRALVALRIGRGDVERSAQEIEALAARFPASVALAVARAGGRYRQGDAAGAAAGYREVLRDHPDLRAAEFGLGRALVGAAGDAEAEAWISRLEAKYPNDAAAAVLRGALCERRGDSRAAGRAYRLALALDPPNAEARRGLDRVARAGSGQ